MMESEGKSQKGSRGRYETDFVFQWGSKKKKHHGLSNKSKSPDFLKRKEYTPRVHSVDKKSSSPRLSKTDLSTTSGKLVTSPEKEDRYYTTRGSSLGVDEDGKTLLDNTKEDIGGPVWPKLFIALSNKEKEEDFMAMKGCKPPQRPKKRAKAIQKSLLLVSPGTWLSDLCQERYEVREKKGSKKRPRGLKAMRSMESSSE